VSYQRTCTDISVADYPRYRAAVQKVVVHLQDQLTFTRDKRKMVMN
jgi:hypothetical protein